MKWRIYSMIAGLMIFGLPIFLLNTTALSRMANFQTAVEGETPVPETIVGIGSAIDNAFDRHFANKEIQNTFASDKINKHRQIRVRQTFTIEDVLEPGEEMPPVEMHRLYISARAAEIMMRECQVIIESLGTKCGVGELELVDRKNELLVQTVFGYVPAYDVGQPARYDTKPEMRSIDVRIYPENASSETATFDADLRRTIYAKAQELCATVRTLQKSCIIASIDFPDRADGHIGVRLKWVSAKGKSEVDDNDPVWHLGSDNIVVSETRTQRLHREGKEIETAAVATDDEPAAESAQESETAADKGGGIFGKLGGLLSGGEKKGGPPAILKGGGAFKAKGEGKASGSKSILARDK